MATHTFYLYRYQSLPITKQYDLRYDLDEIIRNKNEYFKNAILQLKHELPKSKKKTYTYEVKSYIEDNFLVILSKKQNVKYYTHEHREEYIDSFPPARIIINNKSNVQVIAIEKSKYAPNTIRNVIEHFINNELERNNLSIKIAPLYKESTFWNFIEQNKDHIEHVKFTLITPNMSNISGGLCSDLKEIAKRTKAVTSEYKIIADKNATLRIDDSDSAIAGLAEYTANGGGSAQIKLRNSKVKYKSNDHQLEIEIGDFDFNGPLSSIGDKIQKAKNS